MKRERKKRKRDERRDKRKEDSDERGHREKVRDTYLAV